jgi:30S ribosomal protein S31
MGKGDKKSKRGKIANKSYGVRRPRKIKKRATVEEKISLKGKA